MIAPRTKSLLEVHAAVLLFGMAGLFGKLLALPATVIVFGRVFFAAAFLAMVLKLAGKPFRLERSRDYAALFGLGIVLALHWVAFFRSIQLSTVAVGLLTFSTFPVFVTFLEPLFFRERLRVADVLTAAVAFWGVFLVVPGTGRDDLAVQGVLWGVGSGASFALLSVLNRKMVRDYPALTIAFYQDAAAALVLLPFPFFFGGPARATDAVFLVLLGVVFTGISHSLFIRGLRGVRAQTASVIATLEPVYGIALAAIVLAEIPSRRVLVGGLLIVLAAGWASVRGGRRPEPSPETLQTGG